MGLNEFLPPPPLNPSFPMGPSSQTSPDSWVVIRGFLISIYIYSTLQIHPFFAGFSWEIDESRCGTLLQNYQYNKLRYNYFHVETLAFVFL